MYTIWNVEERNRQWPDTFHIPSRIQREALFVGDAAKCVFVPTDGPGGERMWLRILKPISQGKYYGELLNEPVAIAGLKKGDKIEFGPEHISDFQKEPRGGLLDPGLGR